MKKRPADGNGGSDQKVEMITMMRDQDVFPGQPRQEVRGSLSASSPMLLSRSWHERHGKNAEGSPSNN